MSELRQKQKEKRERDILAAAARLLAEKGYQATSVEEIAELAEVGAATVYNYFSTKADVVKALLFEEMGGLLEAGERIVRKPPADAAEAVSALLVGYTTGLAGGYRKGLLREIIALIFTEQATYRKEIIKVDFRLIDQLAELMEILKRRRQLARGVDSREAATILFTAGMTDFIVYITDDDFSKDDMKKAIRRHIRLVFRGLAPGNGGGHDDQ